MTDGWYIDDPELPREMLPGGSYTLNSGGLTPVVRATHKGPAIPALAGWEKITVRSLNPRAEPIVAVTARVTDLYKGVLAAELFEPPPNFAWVARLGDVFFVQGKSGR